MNRHCLKNDRLEILWWEICCLLHDIGKLSDEFLYYRQRWHLMQDGWEKKDPHDHDWLGKDKILPKFTALDNFFRNPIPVGHRVPGTLSVWNAIQQHSDNPPPDDLLRLLKYGDKTDSRDDRNNPLIGCEQTDHSDVSRIPRVLFRSNVFGYEGERTRVDVPPATGPPDDPTFLHDGVLARARKLLYEALKPELTSATLDHERYFRVRELLERWFEPAMSDTARPGNDTSLWEHVYSVASIAKAVHAKLLLEDTPAGAPGLDCKPLFRVWGMGFDGLRFLSFSHKIGDILGRRDLIRSLFERVRRELVFETPVGNDIYRDDNCILFLVANVGDAFYASLNEEFEKLSAEITDGELQPSFTLSEPTSALTVAVGCIEDLRQKSAVPYRAPAGPIRDRFNANWQGQSASVCAVCRVRPARRAETQEKLCESCRTRRKKKLPDFLRKGTRHQTPFVSEIADANRRVALIVAQFGLRDWLNGKLVRTNLITEAEAIRKTLTAYSAVKDLKGKLTADQQSWINSRSGDSSFERIVSEFTALRSGAPRDDIHALPIYGRPFPRGQLRWNDELKTAAKDWTALLDAAETEAVFSRAQLESHLLNIVCAKSPTPSTILDIWDATGEFLENITRPREGFDASDEATALLHEMLPPRPRVWVQTEETLQLDGHETAVLLLAGRSYDVVYENKDRLLWILRDLPEDGARDGWRGRRGTVERDDGELNVTVAASGIQEDAYLPYREISRSPETLFLLVPADRALDITLSLYGAYCREFGKAWGRLPFSVGVLFFPDHVPMFAVLDGARRMQRNFDWLHRLPWQKLKMPITTARLTLKLGDEAEDWHHPYIFTDSVKPSRFETLMGRIARLEDIESDDEVSIRPNYFDYEWLGASSGRFHLHLPRVEVTQDCLAQGGLRTTLCRTGGVGKGPMLLDDLKDKIVDLWTELKESREISDSRLRNLDQLLSARRLSWRADQDPDAAEVLNGLAATLLHHYLPERHERVRRALDEGFFERMMDLYVRILKDRMQQGGPNA